MAWSVSIRMSSIIPIGIMLAILLPSVVNAHEGEEIGPYEFVVGFSVEPAYEGIQNGVDLRVHIPAENAGEEATPVEGLEETLQVEVTHVPSGKSKTFALRSLFGDPGHYTADFIPTAPGQYRFRFFGTVEGMAIDEMFESGPGRFSDIESTTELQFPEQVPAPREMESAIRGAQLSVAEAQDSASSLYTLAIVAIVLGGIGAVSGLLAVFMLTRRPAGAETVVESRGQ